ncbi:MAG TPA: hypothetical protein VHO69_16025 [Phototrophicaceae bacterium]|nr:hypothetical protein [Phototrophicaceae bacterium]
MTVHIDWHDANHSILLMQFEKDWTLEDLRYASEQGWSMMATVDHKVYTIMDVTQGNKLPSGFLPYARRLVSHRPANAGLMAIAGGTPLMRAVYSTLLQIYGAINPTFKVRFVNTVADACEAISVTAIQSDGSG